MSRWHVMILGILLISSYYSASAGDIPFTPAGLASLRSKNICDLQGEFPIGVAVYLDRQKENAIDYRERDGVYALFLLSKPLQRCGIVDAVLNLTPLIKQGEKAEFKCYTDREGGTTWGKWGHVVGLANDQGGTKPVVKARLAWRVNIKEKRFEEIHGPTVRCDTSGYEKRTR